MIRLVAKENSREAAEFVLAAVRRSVSSHQATWFSRNLLLCSCSDIIIAIDPDEDIANKLLQWLKKNPSKLILFGKIPPNLMSPLCLRATNWPEDSASWSRSPSVPAYSTSQSRASIIYTPTAERFDASNWQRPLERFDFADEWNNLGYGRIRADQSIWSLSAALIGDTDTTLAEVTIDGEAKLAYSALRDQEESSILWFNRSVGPIDSFEWRLIELFLSSYRPEELPCLPVIQEVPWGHNATVTMRLDCDEDVESARSLRDAYNAMDIPFSLAIHTKTLDNTSNHSLLQEMSSEGESILSHSASHASNWGGSYNTALHEAKDSYNRLKHVTDQGVRYAVSPFHQTPYYALLALSDAGYSGCIGGIIKNDPEFLISRGGLLAGMPSGFIGHSQQHMLHGECMLSEGDPLRIFKQAFDYAHETGILFGYLDHPFSPRYQYGWKDETHRVEAHQALINYIRNKEPGTIFLSENDALDFLLEKSKWQIIGRDGEFELTPPIDTGSMSPLKPTIEYRGKKYQAKPGKLPAA